MFGSRKDTDIESLKERIEKLESQMHYLLRSLGIESGEPPSWRPSSKVLELLASGKKIEAIKAFREASGASLKDAKMFIESLGEKKRE